MRPQISLPPGTARVITRDQLPVDPSEWPHQNIISVYVAVILISISNTLCGRADLTLSSINPILHKTRKETKKDERFTVFERYRCVSVLLLVKVDVCTPPI